MDACVFFGICVSVHVHLTIWSSKMVCMKNLNNLDGDLGKVSKTGYLYFVSMVSVSSVKVEPKIVSCNYNYFSSIFCFNY